MERLLCQTVELLMQKHTMVLIVMLFVASVVCSIAGQMQIALYCGISSIGLAAFTIFIYFLMMSQASKAKVTNK